jgi:AcrR family transcriptional regulator
MPQQQRSNDTHARILHAGLECFSRAGYDASGVAEICAAAGVSKGAFYHHFPTKQALFLELLHLWLAALDARFAEVRAGAGSVPAALRAMAGAARQVFLDARGQLPLFLEFWTQAARDPLVWQATIEPYRRYQAYFADLIRAGIAEGSLRPVDPEAAARAVIALALGMLVQGVSGPDQGAGWPETALQGINFLLEGIEKI